MGGRRVFLFGRRGHQNEECHPPLYYGSFYVRGPALKVLKTAHVGASRCAPLMCWKKHPLVMSPRSKNLGFLAAEPP